MKAWEKPEVMHLDFQNTMQNGRPTDGEDSVYTETMQGLTYNQCNFGKKVS